MGKLGVSVQVFAVAEAIPTVKECSHRAHGVVVSHPLRMREALGSIPSVSILQICKILAHIHLTPLLVARWSSSLSSLSHAARKMRACRRKGPGFNPQSRLGRKTNKPREEQCSPTPYQSSHKAPDTLHPESLSRRSSSRYTLHFWAKKKVQTKTK